MINPTLLTALPTNQKSYKDWLQKLIVIIFRLIGALRMILGFIYTEPKSALYVA